MYSPLWASREPEERCFVISLSGDVSASEELEVDGVDEGVSRWSINMSSWYAFAGLNLRRGSTVPPSLCVRLDRRLCAGFGDLDLLETKCIGNVGSGMESHLIISRVNNWFDGVMSSRKRALPVE